MLTSLRQSGGHYESPGKTTLLCRKVALVLWLCDFSQTVSLGMILALRICNSDVLRSQAEKKKKTFNDKGRSVTIAIALSTSNFAIRLVHRSREQLIAHWSTPEKRSSGLGLGQRRVCAILGIMVSGKGSCRTEFTSVQITIFYWGERQIARRHKNLLPVFSKTIGL